MRLFARDISTMMRLNAFGSTGNSTPARLKRRLTASSSNCSHFNIPESTVILVIGMRRDAMPARASQNPQWRAESSTHLHLRMPRKTGTDTDRCVAQVLYVPNESADFDRRMHAATTGLVVLSLLMMAAGACADSPDAGGLDEILVTAQRRSENLQTVPIAITALSGQAMAEAGVHDLGTLAAYVPGLTFSPFSQDQNI